MKPKKQANAIINSCETSPWKIKGDLSGIILIADEGKELRISAPWCGYFETLHSAEIMGQTFLSLFRSKNSDMKISFGDNDDYS